MSPAKLFILVIYNTAQLYNNVGQHRVKINN